MKKYSFEKLQKAARILKIMAHPVKLQILQILENEASLDVSSICEKVGASCEISMMSHHLAKMKDNGILNSKKVGKQVFYQIADENILSIFNCIEKSKLM